MPFLPVILWTDILIYILLATVVASVIYIRNRSYLLTPWKRVFQSKRAVISAMLLSVYVIVGLLDSVHFRLALAPQNGADASQQHYSTEVMTLLDLTVLPLKQRLEKTYSAPFSTHAFVREMQTNEEGKTIYDYAPLRYGGSHLANPVDKQKDIFLTVIEATLWALVITALIFASLMFLIKKLKQQSFSQQLSFIKHNKTSYPVKTAMAMVVLILIVASNLFLLSQNYHVLGTDKVGQDVFYQTLKSVRTGLVIGTLTTIVMLPFAIVMGISAGYFKGWIDDVIQYIYTTLNSIPGVLLIAAAVLSLQVYMNNHPESFSTIAERQDMRLLFLCIILGMTSWTGLCRILRGETLKLRESEFVLAARALGKSNVSILHKHILPNLMHIVLITIVLDFSGLVLAEAVLSYVGVGVDPSMMSWGNMINSARLEMARDPFVWWSLVAAFISMFILVLSANLFADVVRDAFDPRNQGSRA